MPHDLNDFETIIREKRFYHAFQPIYDLKHWNVFGYEVLLRSDKLQGPETLFRYAQETNRLFELDTSSLDSAFELFERELKNNRRARWFLNVFPSTLVHPEFERFMNERFRGRFAHHHITIEVNEAEEATDMAALKEAIDFLSGSLGFAIALDDLGKGSSSLRAIVELEPGFIKLDRYFSVNLSTSPAKQRVLRMLLAYCQESGAHLVMEGIEDQKDLAIAKAIGVHMGQGYLLGKPASLPRKTMIGTE